MGKTGECCWLAAAAQSQQLVDCTCGPRTGRHVRSYRIEHPHTCRVILGRKVAKSGCLTFPWRLAGNLRCKQLCREHLLDSGRCLDSMGPRLPIARLRHGEGQCTLFG